MTKSVGGDSRMILIGDRAMDDMLMGRAININPALTDVMMMIMGFFVLMMSMIMMMMMLMSMFRSICEQQPRVWS